MVENYPQIKNSKKDIFESANFNEWFDEIIATIRTHQLMLETKTADKEKTEFYETLISGSNDQIIGLTLNVLTKVFIKQMIFDFVLELKVLKINLVDVAFDYNNSGLLVWAIINDDDEFAENQLLLAAAKINSKYNQYSLAINTTILEESDQHPIPGHYQSILNY